MTKCFLYKPFLINPHRLSDRRGYFGGMYSHRSDDDMGVGEKFVKDNHSFLYVVSTLRGLHLQTMLNSQVKLVRSRSGAIFDVAVGIRRSIPSYGELAGHRLTLEN
jgi:dTDP-4-dehydrorhamnose 3,5-epimerase